MARMLTMMVMMMMMMMMMMAIIIDFGSIVMRLQQASGLRIPPDMNVNT